MEEVGGEGTGSRIVSMCGVASGRQGKKKGIGAYINND